MKWKKPFIFIISLFLLFVITILLVDLNPFRLDGQNNPAIFIEGITLFTIFTCIIITIQFKTERILIIGWFFLMIGAFMDILAEIESLSISQMVELVFENGMFAVGMISISIGFILVIKKRDKLNEELKYMALHDFLTGLPNRYMFNEYLTTALVRCKRNNQELAVLFLDLDRFKFINDTLGHEVGDTLLKQVTERLLLNVRDGDIVARQGGDEFLILLEDVKESEVRVIAERILNLFKTPFILNNEEYFTSPSIGISLYPTGGSDNQTLIKNADHAMYLTKKHGKNHYKFFIPESEIVNNRKSKLERGLRTALDNNEMVLFYQPQIRLDTGEWIGVEALIRWNHPIFGLVSPIEFIPIAEETSMIIPIGNWVIETVCQQSKLWEEKGFPPLKISINVSTLQFENENFVELIKKLLVKYKIEPEILVFEITETVMHNVNKSLDIFNQLRKIGIKISIDDFGTGYSSLSILNQLPIDYVKIDKSFVQMIGDNYKTTSLVKTIIEMGKNLNFDLIAEGIETDQQMQFLTQNGCSFGQGYLYGRPIPVEEIVW